MYKNSSGYLYSPSDLNAFLDNECVTWLDRYNLECPNVLTRDDPTDQDQLVRGSGDQHEQRVLSELESKHDVVRIDRTEIGLAFVRTAAAMRDGREIIYQGYLQHNSFAGWSDFLVRVPGSSDLGEWNYEVWDTKLALSMKPYFAIQLCCYLEMLQALQGRLPDHASIVLGNREKRALKLSDYFYYYQAVKDQFLEQQLAFDHTGWPELTGGADYGHWTKYVDGILEARNDVSLVANIRSVQVEKLKAANIFSMRDLANSALETVPTMARDTFDRLRKQAQLQLESQPDKPPPYAILKKPVEVSRRGVVKPPTEASRRGFDLLPPASVNDVVFDIEGYPMIEGGLEYLLGAVYRSGTKLEFADWWAHDRVQEKQSFEAFVDWIYARWKQDPGMHVYHYAAYETTALKRLMCRYASREAEVDELLRNHVFVDLYTVVRQALQIGAPSYSLKQVEHLYLEKRTGDVATAGDSIVFYHQWMTGSEGPDWSSSKTLKLIRDYNREDCESTWSLIAWLRPRRAEAGYPYVPHKPATELKEDTVTRSESALRMLKQIPEDRAPDADRWRVHELLAHLLEFHRRQDKSLHWKRFERLEMTDEELLQDSECLAGLERTEAVPTKEKKSFVYEYRFPEQESKLRDSSKCELIPAGIKMEIEKIDYDGRLVTLKRATELPDRLHLIPSEIVDSTPIVESIVRVVEGHLSSGALQPALSDFLFRRRPRVNDSGSGPLIKPGEDMLAGATRAVRNLQQSTLCIQGPPGSGKTRTAGKLIAQLLKAGKRIGITSHGHEVIRGLMTSAVDAAISLGVSFSAAKCNKDGDKTTFHDAVEIFTSKTVFQKQPLPDLIGGTAWVFSRPEAEAQFDYLFIDEAGQVCLANLVGMSAAAKNLVLMGDQMQLAQPVQGSHPGESGQSILDYYLQEHATIPDDLGIFLPTTWRMRPEICSFISNSIYDGRLKHEPAAEGRSIRLARETTRLSRSNGLLYYPVEHENNSSESQEEVAAVQQIVRDLIGQTFEESGKAARPLRPEDILIVAPFNLQVRKLKNGLGGEYRIGTVDKFQGQQAPVVLFSMTSSDCDSSPRGVDFLFERNRLNVAISRAQVLAVLIASPKLLRARCSRLDQMPLVNMFCRAVREGGQREYVIK